MKKILKPGTSEEAVYYSDFTGKIFNPDFGPPVKLTIACGYGSIYDGDCLEFHLDDADLVEVIDLIKSKLTTDKKQDLKNHSAQYAEETEERPSLPNWLSLSERLSSDE